MHLFLFEIRANEELRYLVTARAEDIEREHELLDRVLIAVKCVTEPVVRLADPGGGQLWSALGMPTRAAFVIAVGSPG